MKDFLRRRFHATRQSCWVLIAEQYPETKTKYDLSLDLVRRSVSELGSAGPLTILDVGCGHGSGISFGKDSPHTFIGTDYVLSDVRQNRDIDLRFCSNIEQLPLRSGSVDIMFFNMVLEHVRVPASFWSECGRVLKPGGYAVFATPCIYNIVTAVNSLIPTFASKKLGKVLTEVNEDDTFPTAYRSNSVARIRRYARLNHLTEVDLVMYQPPPYAFVFSKTICRIAIWYFKVLNRYPSLRYLRGIIIGRYRKDAAPGRSVR